jgi:hypothetical protein
VNKSRVVNLPVNSILPTATGSGVEKQRRTDDFGGKWEEDEEVEAKKNNGSYSLTELS